MSVLTKGFDQSVQSFFVFVCVLQVGQAKDSSLTNQLIDYLMGESDNMPKVISAL